MARQKPWHRTSAWEAPNIPVRLWGPASDLSLTSGGYYAEKSDGRCIRTTAIIVPKWKHQACQVLHSERPQLLNPEELASVGPGRSNSEHVHGEGMMMEPQAQDGLQQELDFELDLQQDGPPLEIVQEVEVLWKMQMPMHRRHSLPPRRRLHKKTPRGLAGAVAIVQPYVALL